MVTGSNKALVRRWLEEGWNGRRADLIDELFSTDFVARDGRKGIAGRSGAREFFTALITALPDLHVEIAEMIGEGEWVCARIEATGTHEGELFGFQPTGAKVRFPAMVSFKVENGEFSEVLQDMDSFGLIQALKASSDPTVGADALPTARMFTASQGSVDSTDREQTERNKQRLLEWFDAMWHRGDLDRVEEYAVESVVLDDACSPIVSGRDQLRGWLEELQQALHSVRIEPEMLIAEKDLVACRFGFTATHGGELLGVAATGRQVESTGTVVARMNGGRIVKAWQVWDALGVLEQVEGAE